MILSHAHRFIFLKTKKTAGTSVELALSELCGPDDVITPVIKRDEALRRGRKPQNYLVAPENRTPQTRLRVAIGQEPRKAGSEFFNHMSARQVKRLVPTEVWRTYRKVTIERNPWDREVSYYFWQWKRPDKRPPFDEYVLTRKWRAAPVNNYRIYSIGGRPVADTFLRYETLLDDFAAFVRSLDVASVPDLPSAKGAFRPSDSRDYRSFYDERTRQAVARLYAPEIALFGYEF